MKKYQSAIPALFLLLTSCGSSAPKPPSPNDSPKVSAVEVHLSRASFSGSEFEHYKVFGTSVYRECGEMRQGRYLAHEQRVVTPPAPQLTAIKQEADQLFQNLYKKNEKLEEPSSITSPFGRGTFEARFEANGSKTEVKTSVDTVSNASKGTELGLKRLAELLRGSENAKFCNNENFFGIDRKLAY